MSTQTQPALIWREDVYASDLDFVTAATQESGFFRPDEVALAGELVSERLAKGEASGYEFIFAQQGDQPLGYACYGHIAGTLHSWDLYWIVVRPDIRSHGLGSEILAQVEGRVAAAGGERLYVETSSQPLYQPTRRFYQSRGYTLLTVLEDFYARGDGKVIYAKVLPAPLGS
jgi:GNAT superfamily N-acetyltransferase